MPWPTNPSQSISRRRLLALALFAGLLAGILYWLVDTWLHVVLDQDGSFRRQLFNPRALDLIPRALVTFGTIVVTWLAIKLKVDANRLRVAQFMIDHAGDEVTWISRDGKLLYVNHAVCKRLGYTQDELLRMYISDIDPIYSPEIWQGHWEELREKKLLRLETLHRSKSGETFPVDVTARYLVYQGRELNCGFVRDISERKQVEKELREYAAKLKEASDLKDLFTDILRHDLLNPASAIKTSAELLSRMEADPGKKKIVQNISRSVGSLIELCENAASYARATSAEQISFGEMDLCQLAKNVIRNFDSQLAERRIALRFEEMAGCVAPVSPVIADAFSNLISNAIKYSPEGSEVQARFLDEGDGWGFSVRDQGPGIPDEYKEKIFTRFERLGKQGVKGSGLGLAIAKQVVGLHHGKIWVQDNPGGGSDFRVWIPKGAAVAKGA